MVHHLFSLEYQVCYKSSFKLHIYVANQVFVSKSALGDEVGDFFALVSMKSPNFCQKAKF
jgi:hypothetical protein